MTRRRRRAAPKRGKSPVLPELAQPERRVPRRLRVEGELHEEMSIAIARLEDPRLADLTVTRVRLTEDLQLARVYVHAGADTDVDEGRRREILRGLRSASIRLRRQIAETLDLRFTPELRYEYDEGVDAARRVDELLEEIRAEEQGSG